MDASEALVQKYLDQQGFRTVEYEPAGNVPPDFLVDGTIAVEVRRLNQNTDEGGRSRGLEETAIPLGAKMRRLLESLGPPRLGQSWFVYYRFERPLSEWRILGPKIKKVLIDFAATPDEQGAEITLERGFFLKIFRSGKLYPQIFVLGGYSDKQSGGWLLAEMETNLNLVVAEKNAKIAPYRVKYPTWWLLLPDHIGYGLDDFDRKLFREQVSVSYLFDRIVLLDPRDPSRAFEL
jgi:hypothetical protein